MDGVSTSGTKIRGKKIQNFQRDCEGSVVILREDQFLGCVIGYAEQSKALAAYNIDCPRAGGLMCWVWDEGEMRTNWTTNKVYFSDLLPDRYPKLYKELSEEITAAGHQVDLLRGTRDIWCRDFMPIQVHEAHYVQFQYKPDYLSGYEEKVTDAYMVRQMLSLHDCRQSPLVIDGGNVVNNTDTIIMTDKVMKENPGLTSSQVRSRIRMRTGVKNVLLIPVEPDDECGHSDGVLQFLDEKTLLVNDYSMAYPDYGKRVLDTISAAGFDYIEIPYVVDEEVGDNFPSALGNYVNILYMENLVVIPQYGNAEDMRVREIYDNMFKGRKVKYVDCCKLAKEGGVLNCISWNIRVPSGL